MPRRKQPKRMTGPFLGTLATVLDQHRAIDMAYPLVAEIVLQSGQGRGLTAARWFPNGARVVYMQVDETAKRRKAGVVTTVKGLTGVAAFASDLYPVSTGGKLAYSGHVVCAECAMSRRKGANRGILGRIPV